MGSYTVGMVKFSAGYEHIAFDNPDSPLAQGSLTIGGYVLAFTSNAAFNNQKTLQVFWAGVKIAATPDLDLLGAYYGYKQNSFATGANAGCSGTQSSGCSGTENAVSLVDRKSTRLNSSHLGISYAVFCLKKKKRQQVLDRLRERGDVVCRRDAYEEA